MGGLRSLGGFLELPHVFKPCGLQNQIRVENVQVAPHILSTSEPGAESHVVVEFRFLCVCVFGCTGAHAHTHTHTHPQGLGLCLAW